MKKNKVLWFDDEHESLIKLKREGLIHNIELVGFKSNEKGMEELGNNYHEYQAVLLDARFYIKEDEEGNGDIKALMKTKMDLDSFQSKNIRYFLLTGQADLTQNDLFDETFPEYYVKGDSESVDKLWKDLKIACQQDQDYQIISEYNSVFDSLESLDKISVREIIDVIEKYNCTENEQVPRDFGSLRTILERIIEQYKEAGFIPEKVHKAGLNASVRFIAGKDYNFHLTEEILSPYVGKIAQDLNYIVNDGTHDKEDLILKVQEHIRSYNSRYAYRSCVNQLFELMIFSNSFFKRSVKSGMWTRKNEDSTLEGIIGYDGRTWYCGKYSIHHKMIEKKDLKVGDKIRILQYKDNTVEVLKNKYPLFASNLEKL